jgi:hypothetical protein
MTEDPKYWFPAKRYGWGWGLPRTWQGWVVIVSFALLIILGKDLFPPKYDLVAFIIYVLALILGLTTICWYKGEPLGWRWGKRMRS